jgi:hypothetical protein
MPVLSGCPFFNAAQEHGSGRLFNPYSSAEMQHLRHETLVFPYQN